MLVLLSTSLSYNSDIYPSRPIPLVGFWCKLVKTYDAIWKSRSNIFYSPYPLSTMNFYPHLHPLSIPTSHSQVTGENLKSYAKHPARSTWSAHPANQLTLAMFNHHLAPFQFFGTKFHQNLVNWHVW